MSKMVYIDTDIYGRKYVREIIPDEARPVAEWYNAEFASHCVEAPDDIQQNMLYDGKARMFSEWMMPEEPLDTPKSDAERLEDLENAINILLG